MKKILAVNSERETFNEGKALGRTLKKGDIVSLNGELGAGKTVFAKGIAKALGINEYVTSPTFTLVNEYDEGVMPLYHFDVYRINELSEMYEIGFDEYLYSDGVTVIEWGNLVQKLLPYDIIKVDIKRGNDNINARTITIIDKKEK